METTTILKQTLLSVHLIGLAFGIGGAAVADYMFFLALKMGDRISAETVMRMRSISNVVWAGIGLLAISGVGLFFLKPSYYMASQGFLAKMVLVGILIINGIFLNFYTTARLTTFNFSQTYTRRDAAWKARKLSFVFGAVSMVTWYFTLALAMFKGVIKLPFAGYIGIYFFILGSAIVGALITENILHYRYKNQPQTIDHLTQASIPMPPRQPIPQASTQNTARPLQPVMSAQEPLKVPTNQPVQPTLDNNSASSKLATDSQSLKI